MRARGQSCSSGGTARSGIARRIGSPGCGTWCDRRSRRWRQRRARGSGILGATVPRSEGIPAIPTRALRDRLLEATEWLPRLVARVPATVHTKLLVGFLVIAVLLVSLGAVGLQVLGRVNRRAEDLVQRQQRIAAYRQFQRDTALPPSWFWNDATLEATLQRLNEFRYEVDQLQFVAMDDGEPLRRLREDYDRLTDAVTQLLGLMRAGNAAAGRAFHLATAGPLAARVERATNDLVNKAEADMAD